MTQKESETNEKPSAPDWDDLELVRALSHVRQAERAFRLVAGPEKASSRTIRSRAIRLEDWARREPKVRQKLLAGNKAEPEGE